MVELFLKNNWRSMLFLIGLVLLWIVFPTPYSFWITNKENGTEAFRMNRLTGKIETWYPSLGWATWSTDSWIAFRKAQDQKKEAAGLK